MPHPERGGLTSRCRVVSYPLLRLFVRLTSDTVSYLGKENLRLFPVENRLLMVLGREEEGKRFRCWDICGVKLAGKLPQFTAFEGKVQLKIFCPDGAPINTTQLIPIIHHHG